MKTYSTSLHGRILTSHVFLYCAKRSLHKRRLIKLFTRERWSQSHTNNGFLQTCGSTATDLLKILFTQYKSIRRLPLSAVSLSRCITCHMSVFISHMQGSHSVISNKPRLHIKKTYSNNKNPESLCHEQKHMSALIRIERITNRILS